MRMHKSKNSGVGHLQPATQAQRLRKTKQKINKQKQHVARKTNNKDTGFNAHTLLWYKRVVTSQQTPIPHYGTKFHHSKHLKKLDSRSYLTMASYLHTRMLHLDYVQFLATLQKLFLYKFIVNMKKKICCPRRRKKKWNATQKVWTMTKALSVKIERQWAPAALQSPKALLTLPMFWAWLNRPTPTR